jgi:hypothetical protein
MTSKKLVLLLFIFTIVLFKSQSTEEQTKQYYKIALEYDKQPKEAKLKILNLLEVCETKKNFATFATLRLKTHRRGTKFTEVTNYLHFKNN